MKEGKIEERREREREGGSRETETGPDSEGRAGPGEFFFWTHFRLSL